MTWETLLGRVMNGQGLEQPEAAWMMEQVLTDSVSPVQLSAMLAALRTKGETVAEVSGLVETMLAHATPLQVTGPSVDVVGTGGDGHHTVNISTMAAVVVAATGAMVVKHGNRAASSRSGSADVLAALGVNLDLSAEQVAEVLRQAGITFCFAMTFHPAMRFAGPVRKELAVPTTFNILGPLTNPAQPAASAVGVANVERAPLMAGVFASQGRDAVLFSNHDGLDEIAATAPTEVWEVRDGAITRATIDVRSDLGLPSITLDDLRGGDPEHNADVARAVFAGEEGPVLDTVVVNAAAALVAQATQSGTTHGSFPERMSAAMEHARTALTQGRAADLLERWASATQSV